MSLRYRTLLPLAAVCLALIAAPAFAAEKSAPTITTLGNAPAPTATINAVDCQTGQFPGAPAFSAQFVFPPNDEYHTYIDPAGCCPEGGPTALVAAHALLNWPSACDIPVTVSVLGSTGGACPQPDRQNVICPPTQYILSAGAGGFVQHDLPLPAGCCIQGPAFLVFTFVSNGTCPPNPAGLDAPRLLGDGDGQTCVSYNFYPGDPNFRDLVAFYGFPGNPFFWADGHCCGATPTIPSSWGSVKSLYR